MSLQLIAMFQILTQTSCYFYTHYLYFVFPYIVNLITCSSEERNYIYFCYSTASSMLSYKLENSQ